MELRRRHPGDVPVPLQPNLVSDPSRLARPRRREAQSANRRAVKVTLYPGARTRARARATVVQPRATRSAEDHMLDYSIMRPEGILVLKPHAPLSKEDFEGLSAAVDSYLSDHAKLHGVL